MSFHVLTTWEAKVFAFLWDMRVSVILCAALLLVAVGQFRQRRPARGALLLVSIALLEVYLPSLLTYVGGLSSDSFAELSNPKLSEARFFLGTVASLMDPLIPRRLIVCLLATMALAALVLAVSWRWTRRSPRALRGLGWSLALVLVVCVASGLASEYRRSSAEIAMIRENYQAPTPAVSGHARPLHVLVYIGESTGIMDLHLYGYARPTTPALDHRHATDPGLLVYRDAMSTHTHTGASLMDALGIPAPTTASGPLAPIYQRRYTPVVDVLGKAGIDTVLLSNQSMHGTWNAGSAAVFAHVGRRISAYDSALLGNKDEPESERVDDDKFFAAHLAGVWEAGRPQVIFLHSYGGHGPYLQNIPAAFDAPVDATFSGHDPRAVVGDVNDAALVMAGVEQYDSAMRYVDHSVDTILADAEHSAEPVVAVYFSVHGESPWTARGHDSSRFMHEMLRVPLLVYFNAAARDAYPELFARYEADARQVRARSLAALAGTLVDLFGLQATPPIGSLLDSQAPALARGVVVREQDDATSAVFPVLPRDAVAAARQRDDSDVATRLYRLAAGRPPEGRPSYCYHRANSMARARRASLVADCVEFDVVPRGDHLEVDHPPADATGFTVAELFKAIEASGRGLWIDSKDLGGADRCEQLADMLAAWKARPAAVLAEFPPTVPLADPATRACLNRLAQLGVRRSFYVPTALANDCSAAIRAGHPDIAECRQLADALHAAMGSGLLSDLSFDYAGIDAMRHVPGAGALRWDTWGVLDSDVSDDRFKGFGFVIVDTSTDPNFH